MVDTRAGIGIAVGVSVLSVGALVFLFFPSGWKSPVGYQGNRTGAEDRVEQSTSRSFTREEAESIARAYSMAANRADIEAGRTLFTRGEESLSNEGYLGLIRKYEGEALARHGLQEENWLESIGLDGYDIVELGAVIPYEHRADSGRWIIRVYSKNGERFKRGHFPLDIDDRYIKSDVFEGKTWLTGDVLSWEKDSHFRWTNHLGEDHMLGIFKTDTAAELLVVQIIRDGKTYFRAVCANSNDIRNTTETDGEIDLALLSIAQGIWKE
jgi:hypothetical protein